MSPRSKLTRMKHVLLFGGCTTYLTVRLQTGIVGLHAAAEKGRVFFGFGPLMDGLGLSYI